MTDIKVHYPPFDTNQSQSTIGSAWLKWRRGFEIAMEAANIADPKRKRVLLMHFGGLGIQEVLDNQMLVGVPHATTELVSMADDRSAGVAATTSGWITVENRANSDAGSPQSGQEEVISVYAQAMKILDDYFGGMINGNTERYILRNVMQKDAETFDAFVVRVKQQVNRCPLPETIPAIREMMASDQIIAGCRDSRVRERAMEQKLTLQPLVVLGKTLEGVKEQSKHFEPSVKIGSEAIGQIANRPRSIDSKGCLRCGSKVHASSDKKCPAWGKSCRKCGKLNHFENVCKGGASVLKRSFKKEAEEPAKKRIHLVEASGQTLGGYLFNVGTGKELNCIVGGVELSLIIDSGADKSVLGRDTWKLWTARGIAVSEQQSAEKCGTLYRYGEVPTEIVGKFKTIVQVGEHQSEVEFTVVDVDVGPPLLGRFDAFRLRCLRIGYNLNAIESIEPFPKIRGVVANIQMSPDVKPVVQALRRVPLPLEDAVNAELNKLLAMDIIEKKSGPVTWVSPLVPVGKKDQTVRCCIDMRAVNKGVLREKHPLPTVDELIQQMSGSTVFSKLDILTAFHQIELAEGSRDITTFITSKGLFRYKRLNFGLVSAPEIFQRSIQNKFAGVSGVVIFIDDIGVHGRTRQEHDERLKVVLKVCEDENIVLNQKKCVIGAEEISFLGHRISGLGVQAGSDKIEAILALKPAESSEQVRSLLGLVGYVAKFIPNMSDIVEPLRELMTEERFDWRPEHDEALQKIKNELASDPVLGFYSKTDETKLITDASPVGLGAILVQIDTRKQLRVIAYASRALTNLERKYHQTEREALAVVWAMEKFAIYLIGRKFTLLTDCNALVFLFAPSSKPCARIERWVIRVQAFDFDVQHVIGKDNAADILSRMTSEVPKSTDAEDEWESQLICALSELSRPIAISLDEIKMATKDDSALTKVIESLAQDKWTAEMADYYAIRNELTEVEGVVLRGDRIVMPKALWKRTLLLAHEGHLAADKMKHRLRMKVWWPYMDRMAEEHVASCTPCLQTSSLPRPEPMKMTPMPDKPWQYAAIDFMGPLPNGKEYLLVLVDYYSRYMIVRIMIDTSAKATTDVLRNIFSEHGKPDQLKSDNGPQFISMEFKQFCLEYGIKQVFSPPYWPQANGLVERQNRSLLRRLRIAKTQGVPIQEEIDDFLLAYHGTPQETTGKTPAELYFRRQIGDKLPEWKDGPSTFDEGVRERDRVVKLKRKWREDERRKAIESDLKVGDRVLIKIQKTDKLTPNFGSTVFKIKELNGNEALIIDEETGNEYRRSVNHLKKVVEMTDEVISPREDPENEEKEPSEEQPKRKRDSPIADDNEVGGKSINGRPKRDRKGPGYLKDYVAK